MMYIFRLFDQHNAATAVDARLFSEGVLKIGRDPSSDWVMIDPECEISRTHCTVRSEAGQLVLRSRGANGVYDGVTNTRLPDEQDIVISPPHAFLLGRYRIVADFAPQSRMAGDDDGTRTLMMSPQGHDVVTVPSEWPDSESAPLQALTAGSMFDAFCDGAGLDPSMFGAEDPAEIMRRAGAIYRQMVLGVADLMADRDHARSQYRLAHTTISGADNNPFKWAPSQQLAVNLLLAGEAGFLSGRDAFQKSFRAIKTHQRATFRGFKSVIKTISDMFDPVKVDAAVDGQSSFLKARAAVNWAEACRRHGDLLHELEGGSGALDRAFVSSYSVAESELEGPCS